MEILIVLILITLVCIGLQLGTIINHLKELVDQQDAQQANQDDPRY